MKGLIDDNLFKCPACPKVFLTRCCYISTYSIIITQVQGIITLSIDANFGLCRKKAAGSSVHKPLSETSVFCDQHDVNNFIDNYEGVTSRNSSVRTE